MKVTGGCHCGAIKYQAQVNEQKVMICHCTDCQVLSGSAFRTIVISEADGLSFTHGQPKEYIKVAESGNKRAQGFCGDCGSALYATSVTKEVNGDEANGDETNDGEPKIYGIRLGTVDQKAVLTPNAQIWCRSASSWLGNMADIKSFSTVP